ncbi:hypothetical protein D3C76_1727770 [compost metagenome]
MVRPQREMDALTLRVGYDESALTDGAQALGERIADTLTLTLQVPVIVKTVSNESLLKSGPPHKIPRVVKA